MNTYDFYSSELGNTKAPVIEAKTIRDAVCKYFALKGKPKPKRVKVTDYSKPVITLAGSYVRGVYAEADGEPIFATEVSPGPDTDKHVDFLGSFIAEANPLYG